MTADFVPTDTANYTTLIDLAAGSFVITKATPTATLAVNNSPQTTRRGPRRRSRYELGPRRGDECPDGRRGDADDRGDLCGHRGLRADRHDELHLADRPGGRELRDHQGDADGDADGDEFAADVHGRRPGGDGHAHELGPRRGDQRADGRRGDADDGGDLCGDGGLRADRHDELHLADRPGGRDLRDHQGDADGDADGDEFAADVHRRRPGGDGHAHQLGPRRGDERADRRRGDADDRGHLCGDGGLRADRRGELHDADRPGGRELRDHQGDADGDADGEQFAADVHRRGPGAHRHAHELGARRGDERADRRRGDADDRGDLCGDGGLRADRHGELHLADRPRGRELRDHQGDADGDADGEQFAADVHGRRPGGDRHAHELGPRRGDQRADRRRGDADDGGDLCGDRGLRADRHDELHLADRRRGREFRDHQGDADGDADGEQFAADVHRRRPGRDRHAHELGPRRGDERADGRRGDADDRRDLCGDGGLRADRHGELHLADRPVGRELRDHQGDADGDADGEQFAADVHGRRPGGDGHVSRAPSPAR